MLKTLRALFFGSAEPTPARMPAAPSADLNQLLEAPAAALKAGDLDEAERLLEAIVDEHHDVAEVHLMLGRLLHARRRFEDAQDSYVLAACFNTLWWRPQFQIGLLELDRGRFAEAVDPLRKALELGAGDALVHNALGAAYINLDKVEEGVAEFRKALTLQPDLAEAHSNLGYALFRDLECFEEGARHIESALELAPDNKSALCNWTMVLHYRGQTNEALALCEKLLERDPALTEARINRALMLLKLGEFRQGWPDYEARKQSPRVSYSDKLPWPEWDGSSLAGKTIFVYAEQGIGDEIMFSSCLPDVCAKAAACVVECSPKLEALFRRSFPGATIVRKDAPRNSPAIANLAADYKVAMGSLPRFLRNERDDFPRHDGYLRADLARIAYWRQRLAGLPGGRKVGISWRGGLAPTRRSLRSIPLRDWAGVLGVPDIDFVSLQYSDCRAEIADLQQEHGVELHHWQEAIDDYDETAALVAALDLTISVQTAVVHLAGALGKPAWALIPAAPEWRYGSHGDTMPWYPRVRLIRQEQLSIWGPLMRSVEIDLARWRDIASDREL